MRVAIIGAGVAGLVTATLLTQRGIAVELYDRGERLGHGSCSWFAGGMLAPWCEAESAEAIVTDRGQAALDFWPRHHGRTQTLGTLVVAPPRDTADLSRFARRTSAFEWLEGPALDALEPDLAGRFRKALFFPQEAHLDPRLALADLAAGLERAGVPIHFGVETSPERLDADRVIDCRGFAAAADVPGLRGVKGEMLLIRTREITLRRPIRMLHPRVPLYIVPRADGLFMVGATSIESQDRTRITARSLLELLGGAYALHPAFGEAEVVEIGTDVRPAFADNVPAIRRDGRVIRFNGLYRHGFLLSPAYAQAAVEAALGPIAEEASDVGHA